VRGYGDGHYGDCLYGGTDAPTDGYIDFPGVTLNYVNLARTAITAPTVVRQTIRASVDALGVTNMMAGWNSTHTGLSLSALNRPSFFVRRLDVAIIGVTSTAAIPGLVAGVPFWLDAQINATTGAMIYQYSLEQVVDKDSVNWIVLSTPTSANTGTVIVTQSFAVILGNNSSGGVGFPGRIYAFTEYDDGVISLDFRNPDLTGVAPTAPSFHITTGNTATVFRSGAVQTAIVAPVPCGAPVLTADPCPELVAPASGPADRVLTSICPEGDC
jgi:hypothetical protein